MLSDVGFSLSNIFFFSVLLAVYPRLWLSGVCSRGRGGGMIGDGRERD